MKPRKAFAGKSAIDLLEETVLLLRKAGVSTLLFYYAGTLPFVLAFLFFWGEMSAGAYAEERLSLAALGMAAAFIWMKCWHSLFARRLLSILSVQPDPGFSGLPSLIQRQTVVQSTGLFLLPLAAVITIPFSWVYAFYQTFTLDEPEGKKSLKERLQAAMAETKLWPGQNHAFLGLLFIIGLVVFINVTSFLWLVPFMLKTLLGVETVFSRSHYTFLNTTMLSIAIGMTYLLVDPLVKGHYVLRSFYGRSLQSGHDLKVQMRKLRGLAQTLLVTLFLSVSANAGTTDPVKMDRSIDTVLSRSEYAWRSPRIKNESDRKGSKTITRFYDAVGAEIKALAKQVSRAAKAIANWVAKFWKPKTIEKSESSKGGSAAALPAILYGLIGLMLLATAMILWRRWKQDRQRSTPVTALAITAEPDLWAEEISADQLPEERWLELAREMIAKGELRLGLRAMYLAGLAHLGSKEFVRLERAKSNRDFLNELRRKARPHPELIDAFHENVKAFERIWYGAHPVNREIVDLYTDNLNRIRQF